MASPVASHSSTLGSMCNKQNLEDKKFNFQAKNKTYNLENDIAVLADGSNKKF